MSMLDYTEFRRIVESYIQANYTETAVKYENVPIVGEPDEWIALFDKPSISEATGMLETSAMVLGVIIIQIFTPLDQGTERSREIAQVLSDLLASKEISGIAFDVSALVPAPANESWYQQNLQIPYTAVMGQDTIIC